LAREGGGVGGSTQNLAKLMQGVGTGLVRMDPCNRARWEEGERRKVQRGVDMHGLKIEHARLKRGKKEAA